MKIYRVPKGMELQIQTILFSRGCKWMITEGYRVDRMSAIRVKDGVMTFFPINHPPTEFDGVVEDLLTFNDYYEKSISSA